MKLSPCPYGGRCAASRLNVPLCTILTALLLFACVSAQAQWTTGNTYYGVSTVTSTTSNTTPTKTASAGTATMSLTSATTNDQNGYRATGSIYGYVYQVFNWGGGQGSTDLYYDAAESVSGSGNGSASSSAGSTSGATDPPYTLSYSASSPRGHGGAVLLFDGQPTTYTCKEWMQVNTTAYYPNSATAKATVVFGLHVFDPGP